MTGNKVFFRIGLINALINFDISVLELDWISLCNMVGNWINKHIHFEDEVQNNKAIVPRKDMHMHYFWDSFQQALIMGIL